MNYFEWQMARFQEGAEKTAMVWRDRAYTYGDLHTLSLEWVQRLQDAGVKSGAAVGVIGDYSPASITCLLALLQANCILVPLSRDSSDQHTAFFRIAELDYLIEIDDADQSQIQPVSLRQHHSLLQKLREANKPGLILFSSGSTGEPKAILHDLTKLLTKFQKPRHCYRTICFLLFDHIGGFNTLMYTLANLGCVIVPRDRSVAEVCRAVADYQGELLPTSPSFLNLMLLADAHHQFDLSSLRLITYGTEVMPDRTLELANTAFPNARFKQTYGLSELGILRSKSAADDSLFVRIGGEGYKTRVVNGTLHIKAQSSMIGYLNAPNPFDGEGWFDTGDAVIEDGEFLRILGRQSDIINVGGQKVYPVEVEKVIAEMPEVIDVSIRGEAHMLLGQVVVAKLQTAEAATAREMKRKISAYCKGRLQPYMVPTKVEIVEDSLVNYRFKKVRRASGAKME